MQKIKICIIGGGIFSTSAAYHLSPIASSIDIYEKNSTLLDGATFYNHNRHHYGYHYPRSDETVIQCQESKKDFENTFSSSLDFSFDNFYAISKKKSRVSAINFKKFCERNGLEYEDVKIPRKIFENNQIAGCFKVDEGIYNFKKLKKIVIANIKERKNININLNKKITKINSSKKIIEINNSEIRKYDVIINATYDDLNNFITKDKQKVFFEYNLQEMIILEIPNQKRFGATILDGEFPSILPFSGHKNLYLFAHVKTSQLIKVSGYDKPLKLKDKNNILTNYDFTYQKSLPFLKILKKSKYYRSFLVVRAVRLNKNKDSRLSEIIDHKNNIYSIFSGKIITCETIAKKLTKIISSKL